MRNLWALALLCVASATLGGMGAVWLARFEGRHATPSAASLVSQVREVARLQTLDVNLHKKISFEPDPQVADGLWGNVVAWAQQTLLPRHGKVIVFAIAHVGLNLPAAAEGFLKVQDKTVWVVLPPLQVDVELLPGETEVIGSNLDSAQTAELLEAARQAFAREVAQDARLQARARQATERALGSLLVSLGFERVLFVATLPADGAGAG